MQQPDHIGTSTNRDVTSVTPAGEHVDDAILNAAFDAWEDLGRAVHQAIERADLAEASEQADELADVLAKLRDVAGHGQVS